MMPRVTQIRGQAATRHRVNTVALTVSPVDEDFSFSDVIHQVRSRFAKKSPPMGRQLRRPNGASIA